MEILNQLGIDYPKIIAQIIIFGIVYLILSKYAFGPVTAMLEQRRSRIAEGEANLDTIKENLAASQAQAAAALDKANAEASRIVKEAQAAAAAIAEQNARRRSPKPRPSSPKPRRPPNWSAPASWPN